MVQQTKTKFPGAITPSFNASECKKSIYAKWDKNCFRHMKLDIFTNFLTSVDKLSILQLFTFYLQKGLN